MYLLCVQVEKTASAIPPAKRLWVPHENYSELYKARLYLSVCVPSVCVFSLSSLFSLSLCMCGLSVCVLSL